MKREKGDKQTICVGFEWGFVCQQTLILILTKETKAWLLKIGLVCAAAAAAAANRFWSCFASCHHYYSVCPSALLHLNSNGTSVLAFLLGMAVFSLSFSFSLFIFIASS